MKKNNGFTLVEVIISASILMTVVTTIFPLLHIITTEKIILSDRRTIVDRLHDEMQPFLLVSKKTPYESVKNINQKLVTFTFVLERNYIKGCVVWENAKKKKESHCLYGLPKS
ncbi:prepilin-type N-terminal cleavage/methylation domain-containing protein [Virgibacillus halodenitrificans]|uniref:prepilin-type N-terminal cleavage/methylation domain-containing protein n=1 Tax=Virgibacillus halodenitrificans TaxID=1482 RepID=UPI00136DBCEA|nr:prepilin-type N-terminal cleavage/methylation domain-containing protein [Virgibacillus halodenitrificans]MEC2158425.1 prepilin-type N-terminal cleavage/methylation domain-containing protein [Virgibacillus halodenitrificans]